MFLIIESNYKTEITNTKNKVQITHHSSLLKLPLPFPQHQKHRHPCVYHVVVARTYSVVNVLLPQHPTFKLAAAHLNAIAFLLAITCK